MDGEQLISRIVGRGGEQTLIVEADAPPIGVVDHAGAAAGGAAGDLLGQQAVHKVAAVTKPGIQGVLDERPSGGVVGQIGVIDLRSGMGGMADLEGALSGVIGRGGESAVGVVLAHGLSAGIVGPGRPSGGRSIGGRAGICQGDHLVAGIEAVVEEAPGGRLLLNGIVIGVVSPGERLTARMRRRVPGDQAGESLTGADVAWLPRLDAGVLKLSRCFRA